MIEINLLPGSGRKSRGPGIGAGFSAGFARVLANIKDPYLLGSIAAGGVSLATVVLLVISQGARERSLVEKEQKLVQDSTRYATVVAEKRRAEAQRDSVLRQVNIIRSIDDDRFVWAHIMDEVSRVMPPYTWITGIAQTSAVVSAAAHPDSTATKPKADSLRATGADTAIVRPTLSFRIVGQTVDIQALTRFMRFLEASPFISNVQLAKTTRVIVEQSNEVTDFQLDAEYEIPDPAAIRRVPFTLSLR
jgi:Tfp pilus assembly protein PilN